MPEQPALRQGLQARSMPSGCPRGWHHGSPGLSVPTSGSCPGWSFALCISTSQPQAQGKGQRRWGGKGKEGGRRERKRIKDEKVRARGSVRRAGDVDRDGQPGAVQAGSGHIASRTFAPVLAKNGAAPRGTAFTQPPGQGLSGPGTQPPPRAAQVPPRPEPSL